MSRGVCGPVGYSGEQDMYKIPEQVRIALLSLSSLKVSKFIPDSLQLYFQQHSIGNKYRITHPCTKEQYHKFINWYTKSYSFEHMITYEQMKAYWLPEADIEVPVTDGVVTPYMDIGNRIYWIYYCACSQGYKYLRF